MERICDVCYPHHSTLSVSTPGRRRVGIEIEMERVPDVTPLPLPPGWERKHDDSLRAGGAEFITNPIWSTQVEQMVSELYDWGTKCAKWRPTSRCGIHVHVDCRDMAMPDLMAVCATYCLVEPALYHFVGKEREESIYCIPWYRGDEDLIRISSCKNSSLQDFVGPDWGAGAVGSLSKYSGLYLEPLWRFGTVEFRQAPSWGDAESVIMWTQACVRLVEFARGKTAQQVLGTYYEDPWTFASKVLGQLFPVPHNYVDLVEENDCDLLASKLTSPSAEDLEWKMLSLAKPPEIIAKLTALAKEASSEEDDENNEDDDDYDDGDEDSFVLAYPPSSPNATYEGHDESNIGQWHDELHIVNLHADADWLQQVLATAPSQAPSPSED